jgi:FMN-dependent NADH-azoreductase
MMKILHLSCSPRGQTSESYRLAQKIIGFLLKRAPVATVINRVVGGDAISPIDANYATELGAATPNSSASNTPITNIAAMSTTQPSRAEIFQQGSMSLSEQLIRELESADFLVIATPMHNFTVPSGLKAWIDHIVRIRRTFNATTTGKAGTLRDRPVFVAVSSGGKYSGEHVYQPDFLTPYLKAILGIIGLHDLTFFSIEGTAFGADYVAAARINADQTLQKYFSTFHVDSSAPSKQEAL